MAVMVVVLVAVGLATAPNKPGFALKAVGMIVRRNPPDCVETNRSGTSRGRSSRRRDGWRESDRANVAKMTERSAAREGSRMTRPTRYFRV